MKKWIPSLLRLAIWPLLALAAGFAPDTSDDFSVECSVFGFVGLVLAIGAPFFIVAMEASSHMFFGVVFAYSLAGVLLHAFLRQEWGENLLSVPESKER